MSLQGQEAAMLCGSSRSADAKEKREKRKLLVK